MPVTMRFLRRFTRFRILQTVLLQSAENMRTNFASFSDMLWFFIMSVFTNPHSTQETEMRVISLETDWVKWYDALFEAVYPLTREKGQRAEDEATFTIAPPSLIRFKIDLHA